MLAIGSPFRILVSVPARAPPPACRLLQGAGRALPRQIGQRATGAARPPSRWRSATSRWPARPLSTDRKSSVAFSWLDYTQYTPNDKRGALASSRTRRYPADGVLTRAAIVLTDEPARPHP